jgi:hypothetical protein
MSSNQVMNSCPESSLDSPNQCPLSINDFREFMRQYTSRVSVPETATTKEEFENVNNAISEYYKGMTFLSPNFIFENESFGKDQWITQEVGVLDFSSSLGIHSIGRALFLLKKKNDEEITYGLEIDCMIRDGKFQGHIQIENFGSKYIGGMSIRGMAYSGKLEGYCEVSASSDSGYETKFKGIFSNGFSMNGTVERFKYDNKSYEEAINEFIKIPSKERLNLSSPRLWNFRIDISVHDAIEGEYHVLLPEFDFDLNTMLMTTPVYTCGNTLVKKDTCYCDDS